MVSKVDYLRTSAKFILSETSSLSKVYASSLSKEEQVMLLELNLMGSIRAFADESWLVVTGLL